MTSRIGSKMQVNNSKTRLTAAQPVKYVTEDEQITKSIFELGSTDDLPFKSLP